MGIKQWTESKVSIEAAIALFASIALAVGGYTFTYLHSRHQQRRKAQLERINAQLIDLYGPLYANLIAGQQVWAGFSTHYWPSHGDSDYFNDPDTTTQAERERWRSWMLNVFSTTNVAMESTILSNTDLIEGEKFPNAFNELLQHVAVYKAVFAQWERDDFSEHTSICNYPAEELKQAIEPVYLVLRRRQTELLATEFLQDA